MPDLFQSLHKSDIHQLRIIAQFWGLELESNDFDSALQELCASLLDLETVSETLAVLPAPAQTALTELIHSNGKIEWAVFSRKHGDLREMGAAKRERERPHLKPISTTEILFHRAFIAKAFFETDKGLQEFIYIPDDLLEVIQEVGMQNQNETISKNEPLGRLATPVEKSFEILANDFILDDATTYLAALRLGRSNWQFDLQKLLETAQLIKNKTLHPENVKTFLEADRPDALNTLYQAWIQSDSFDELRLMPSIICEGEWKNQPQVTREFLMNLINDIPQGKWWSLNSFIKAIKEKFPDFQRPAGDYDSWFIKRQSDGQYLRGFAYWDAVDGALIKYVIQTLHWLGKIDLASVEEGKEITAFRVTELQDTSNKLQGKLIVASNGKISVSRYFSRAVRYQVARFCEWNEEKNNEYHYFINATSLKRANEQGLKAEQLLNLLVKHTNGNVPPAFVKSLKRWEANGVEARVESLFVLRVSNPQVMEEARKSKAGKYFGELLSPTAVVIKSGAIQKINEAFAELGLLTDISIDE